MIDASSMLGSFVQSFPGFETLLNLFVSLVGVVFTGMAIFKFIEVDKGTTRLATPVMYLLAGTALFNFGSSVDTFLQTMYGSSTSVHNLMSYSASSSRLPEQSAKMMQVLIMCIRLYGYYAFIKGWFIVKKIGDGTNGSDEAFGRAMVHMFGGVAAINIVGTLDAISSTFGFGKVL